MKRYIFYTLMLLFTVMTVMTGCKKWLDVNYDPATPQDPDPASVFPTQLAGIPRGNQYDSRYVGRYIQNWETVLTSRTADIVWDQMGYATNSDANGDIWRQCYFGLGKNLNYIIETGHTKGQWDYIGAAYALKAYMFQITTDHHGEIIYTEAFKENTAIFKFDSQDTVYMGVRSLCDSALKYLARTDFPNPGINRLVRGDYSFNGDNAKWIKFTYGILAHNYNHLSRKTALYDPAKVIEFCDKSMTVIADDFLIPFDATKNDDTNFYGPYRDNLTFMRQGAFIVRLLDGFALTGNRNFANRDPRIKHMLSASQDTTNGNGGYVGLEPGLGDPSASSTVPATLRKRAAAPWGDSIYGNPSAALFTPNAGKYLFKDKAVMPVMTSAEIYFIKAEAAFLSNKKDVALDAYTKGINAHFDFINRTTMPRNGGTLYNGAPITAKERADYLASANVAKTEATLTLADIMLQKYIALFGWGFNETWVDLRKYEYNKYIAPGTTTPVYRTFALPQTFNGLNAGPFPVQRARPRFNSEYVWNADELKRIQADFSNYHTKPIWFAIPN
ncbi:SusD/RagB family nutrient-binding outer membrane lipoprotein [Chitinophaga sp. SYP-B3965]|uniref:SusD/RagB family nutrient-binding outer membrane lipoprotein n=1 Tax=Chitinophaga sp. SYP-B3965 TaxID=2663120 RepID=UPI00129A0829|nr:SusD/RagB family nutrient-binding outer membrane lipoprotein [Chitinophaga sp. SYP-B3965]MRG44407.1 SusD/RagB family nutrient-binding outer membrane lipoprotein [Chitinophaga sp. SYP-B3965]